MPRRLMVALVALLLPLPAAAQWDRTKPATSSALASAEIRNNEMALQRTVGGVNLLADNEYLIWPHGDTTAPSHWVLAGAGATIARTGTGLGDTNRKWGTWAAKIVAGGGAVGTLTQSLLQTTAYNDGFDLLHISAGAYVRATASSTCRIGIADGAATTFSSFHAGGSVWSWLEVTRQISSSATKIEFLLEAATSGTCWISGPTVLIGEVPPLYPQPSPVVREELAPCFLSSSQTASNRKLGCDRLFGRPWRLESVILNFTTGPVPTNTTVDVNHFDGSVQQSAFNTGKPNATGVAISAIATPNGTYRYRCFAAANDATQTDSLLTVDVDAVGANPGVDMTVMFRILYFARPLEAFVGAAHVN